MERVNMFCLNMSNDDTGYECDDLLLRQLDERMTAEQKELHDRLHKHTLGTPRTFIFCYIAIVCVVAIGFILNMISSLQPYKTEIIGSVCIAIMAIAAVGVIIQKQHSGKSQKSVYDETDRFYDRCARALHVPEKAPEVDIHTYFYKVKDGVIQNYHTSGAYLNEVMQLFEEDGKLCLFCSDRVWAVPISSMEEIVRIEEEIRFSEWNKETPHNEGRYAQYGIEACEDDEYCMNDYYSIRFTHQGTPYELLIPSYDIEPFLSLIPLTPTCA